MEVAELWVYPIKSCRGTKLEKATLTPRGIATDRQYMVVVPQEGRPYLRFLTQREVPRLALVIPTVDTETGTLRLEADPVSGSHPKLSVAPSTRQANNLVTVKVWDDYCPAIDQGDEAAAWFAAVLGRGDVRLVKFDETHQRKLDPNYSRVVPNHQQLGTGFADGFPFLIVTEASLQQLNADLGLRANGTPDAAYLPIPMRRFRPNIVLRGAAPYAEDTWATLRIRESTFYLVKACARCKMTTVDPAKGEFTPLRGLASPAAYLNDARNWGRGGLFGQNAACLPLHGEIAVGDAAVVLTTKTLEEQDRDKKPLPKPVRAFAATAFATATLVAVALASRKPV
eukprot:TRINITY_DN20951_c0_g1_i1.p1 TRINITY_DN20951_c0_g1~~TRINITY_DN20951_c0_g1_i1.p1  ORF type:complete len:356 (+),score=53.34 TRINITY_DN20951_c0_g1_i1:46-1068(+)